MALYKFKIADAGGKVCETVIEGEHRDDAVSRLRNRGMKPLKFLGEANENGLAGTGLPFFGLSRFNVYDFTDRLEPLLQSHIQLERALQIIGTGMTEKQGKSVVISLRRGLHEGRRFSELIREQGTRFPDIYANLVETGEETGCLPEVVSELQRFMTDSKELREFIITSSIYPVIILSITLLVSGLVFTFLIPRFAKIFIDMGKELPLLTRIMMGTSDFVIMLWPFWVFLVVAGIWLIMQVRKGTPVKDKWDRFVLKLPLLGSITSAINLSRFIRTLAIMLQNHVHLLKTVQVSIKVIDNRTIKKTFADVERELRGGAKLSAALSKSPHIPVNAVQMLQVGEESGRVGDMLNNVAGEMEKRLKIKIKRLLALFEPAVIIVLALVVFLMVLAVFLTVVEMNEM
jgi:type II secretory pathway component PulF